MAKINEEELKKLFIELKMNRKEAVEKIYDKYHKMVYGIAFSLLKNKEDAEDIVQTVFSKLYEIDNHKLPTQKEASWLYTVTKNEALTFLRKTDNKIDLEKIYNLESTYNEINDIIEQENYNQLISTLNNKEKEILSLKILANLSFEEIGELLNQPTSTVKWKYYKSVHTLKIALGNLGMFIITFVIGMKAIFDKNKKTMPKQEPVKEENKTQNMEINTGENQTKGDSNLEKSEEQEILQDEAIDYIEEDYEKGNETRQETIVEEQKDNNGNYVETSFLMLSILFLIISIIFFIKYQLKLKKKTSK